MGKKFSKVIKKKKSSNNGHSNVRALKAEGYERSLTATTETLSIIKTVCLTENRYRLEKTW